MDNKVAVIATSLHAVPQAVSTPKRGSAGPAAGDTPQAQQGD